MTLDQATRILREEYGMTGVEIALVTFMRHMVQRFETLSEEVAALREQAGVKKP